MNKVKDIYDFLCEIAPIEMKMDFDNVGLLVGTSESEVTKILLALDITNDVITESIEHGAQLIISHHPILFSVKSITDTDAIGKKIIKLIKNGISAICMHTNLDAAKGGVNDALAKAAGIAEKDDAKLFGHISSLPSGEKYSIGRYGYLADPCPMPEYLERLKKSLETNGLRYYDSGRKVHKVAVVGGSGGDDFEEALKLGCDTFITADIKYSKFLEAKEFGVNLIDGDHFCTENVVTKELSSKLTGAFPQIQTIISQRHKQVISFY